MSSQSGNRLVAWRAWSSGTSESASPCHQRTGTSTPASRNPHGRPNSTASLNEAPKIASVGGDEIADEHRFDLAVGEHALVALGHDLGEAVVRLMRERPEQADETADDVAQRSAHDAQDRVEAGRQPDDAAGRRVRARDGTHPAEDRKGVDSMRHLVGAREGVGPAARERHDAEPIGADVVSHFGDVGGRVAE